MLLYISVLGGKIEAEQLVFSCIGKSLLYVEVGYYLLILVESLTVSNNQCKNVFTIELESSILLETCIVCLVGLMKELNPYVRKYFQNH